MKKATFGAGCFWHPEQEFKKLSGVKETRVGFMGGNVEEPSYREVCGGDTGHTEVVHILYDPKKVSYKELLDVFWRIHDPTQINRQGPDVGYQYRSVIFYYSEMQKNIAEKSKNEQEQKMNKKFATSIEPAKEFYKAEEYHQNYLEKKGIV